MRTALGFLMISNSALFLFGAVQHAGISLGRFHEPRIIPAVIVEVLCGLFLLGASVVILGHFSPRLGIALSANLVALGGVLLGMVALAAGRGPRTASNDLHHHIMLVLVAASLLIVFWIWTGSASFWGTLSKSSLLLFLAAVFCLFASLGFILDSRNPQETSSGELAINIVVRACFAVCWAFLGTRRRFKSMIPLAVVQISMIWLLGRAHSNAPKLAAGSATLNDKLRLDAGGAIICIIGGYVLFLLFFQREGRRFFAAHTEITLATEIHRSLVPELIFKTREFEFFGASFPSGAVGGDLVDVIMENGGWFGYVADVSGHGVPAGVVMSMTKSATRMRLASRAENSGLLSDMNIVLKPLLTPNMFVTFAYAAWNGGPDLTFSSAGHLPLLHYRASTGNIEQRSVANLPLGILPDQGFASSTVRFECGDVLAIVSDGFAETFDFEDREFGMDGIKKIVQTARGKELGEVSTELRARVLRHGQQKDDQTILLVRRLA